MFAVWDFMSLLMKSLPRALCMRETRMLRRMDFKQRILFTKIAASAFDPAAAVKPQDELMVTMHSRLFDGTWVTGWKCSDDSLPQPSSDRSWRSVGYLHDGRVATLEHLMHPEDRPVIWRPVTVWVDKEKAGLTNEETSANC